MTDTLEPQPGTLASRLRADALRLDLGPSSAAQMRLRIALERAAVPTLASVRRMPRVAQAIVALAAVLALFLVRAAWVPGPDTTVDDARTARITIPAIFGPLVSASPIDAVDFMTEGPLRGELDALALDAVAVADAVLRRIPSRLIPNRRRGGQPR